MKFQNCIHCAVGIALPFGSIVGLPCIKFCCRHTNTLLRITLSNSKLYLCLSLCTLTLLMLIGSLCVTKLISMFHKNDAFFMVMIYTTDLMLHICSISIIIISGLGVKKILGVINVSQDIVTKWQKQTSKILLSKTDTFKVRNRIYRDLTLTGAIIISLMVILFWFDNDPNWSTVEKVGFVISTYTNLMLAVILDTIGSLYRFIYLSYQNHLITELIERFYVHKSLNDSLILYGQLHIRLKRVLEQFNSFVNPTFLVWLLASVTLLISSTSLVLMCLIKSESNPVTVRLITILILLSLFGLAMTDLISLSTNIKLVVSTRIFFWSL